MGLMLPFVFREFFTKVTVVNDNFWLLGPVKAQNKQQDKVLSESFV